MSRGLGQIQRECLRVIESYEAQGKSRSTLDIAAEVYNIEPDRNGKRWLSVAQHVAAKRALASLRRKGLVVGKQNTMIVGGKKMLAGTYGGKSDRIIAAQVGVSYKLVKRVREKNGERPIRAERCCLVHRALNAEVMVVTKAMSAVIGDIDGAAAKMAAIVITSPER